MTAARPHSPPVSARPGHATGSAIAKDGHAPSNAYAHLRIGPELPSGRWQARALRLVGADIARGGYIDPWCGGVTFESYAVKWLEHRPNLRPRTREVYDTQLRRHLLPTPGTMELGNISPSVVRAW